MPRRQPFRGPRKQSTSLHIFSLSIGLQIGDECAVPTDGRDDDGIAERERELGREDDELVLKDGEAATLEQIEGTLNRLRRLRERLEGEQQLEPGDLDLLKAVIQATMETM